MKVFWRKLFYSWRFYKLGREEYIECVDRIFDDNIYNVRQVNTVASIMMFCFALYPVIVEKNNLKAGFYIIAALIALLIIIVSAVGIRRKKQEKKLSRLFISTLIIASYSNIMAFGIYLSVFFNRQEVATMFMPLLICSLFLFINSPILNLNLTISAAVLFSIATVIIKEPNQWSLDIINVLASGFISLFSTWQIVKFRVMAAMNESKLEEERNKYYDQSTIDELTQLKNRRDFMQTFQRYLTNYRSSDDFLCIAIIDIDSFKNYNDYYGHPKGDECLREIGKVFNDIKDAMNIYVARVGGEEFALLWFEKDQSGVKSVVSQIYKTIRELNILHEKSKVSQYITVSTGIYMMQCGTSNDIRNIYELADMALYKAKESGRNCAVISGETFKQYKIKADS